jgi:hypothetical protein
VKTLRTLFARQGILNEVVSDYGPQFSQQNLNNLWPRMEKYAQHPRRTIHAPTDRPKYLYNLSNVQSKVPTATNL